MIDEKMRELCEWIIIHKDILDVVRQYKKWYEKEHEWLGTDYLKRIESLEKEIEDLTRDRQSAIEKISSPDYKGINRDLFKEILEWYVMPKSYEEELKEAVRDILKKYF